MDFATAINEIKSGGRVTREAWNNRKCYVCLQAGRLMIHLDDDRYHAWLISEIDMYSRDWITVADA